MKRITTLLAASLVASAFAAAPALAQGKSDSAPGHGKGDSGMGASSVAPGHMKEGGNARSVAPGRANSSSHRVDRQATASVGKSNFGTLISSIRAGKSDLDGLADNPTVTVISADDLINGQNRVALDNALRDNQDQIDALRADLDDLDLGIPQADIDSAVAARVDASGNLTLYTE